MTRNITLALAVVVAAALASIAAAIQPALIIGGFAAVVLVAAGYMAPRQAVAVWIVVVIFVPAWTPLNILGVSLNPVHVGLPIALGLALSRARTPLKPTAGDVSLILAVASVALLQVLTPQPAWLLFNLVATLLLAYYFGRAFGSELGTVLARAAVVLAIWGIGEFIFDWHAFTDWFPNASDWDDIQTRGGLSRSEAGVGHAIAYGAVLAIALPFTRQLKHPLVAQIVIVLGILASISRGPMIAMVATLAVIAFIGLRGARRFFAIAGSLVAGIVVFFVFDELYSGAAASEVSGSGGARTVQLNRALPLLEPFGPPTGSTVSASGVISAQGLTFIDSTPLRLAVNFGWLPAILLMVPFILVVVSLLRRNAGPATMAIVGQMPIFLVTSLITQWQVVLFFVLGAAVTEISRRRGDHNVKSHSAVGHHQRPKPIDVRV